MIRTIYTFVLPFGLICLWSFRSGDPCIDGNPLIYNTTLADIFNPPTWVPSTVDLYAESLEVDTNTCSRVLMLDYSTYGSAYNEKIRRIISKYLPKTIFSNFSSGRSTDLLKALSGCEIVIVAYPSAVAGNSIKTYNKALNQFVQQGGTVIVTGTHEYEVLQQFGLFDLDFGYYSKERPIHPFNLEHPLFHGLGTEITLANFAYPLDISDPGFVALADVDGYPVVGYKTAGTGKVIYIGVEYYFDELESSQMLINAINWSSKGFGAELSSMENAATATFPQTSFVKHNEEMLYAGSGLKMESIDLKIYPNPYYSKATLDVELSKQTPVMVEMTDEIGRRVALILPKKTIGPGLCRFELPNISPGIYFLQVQLGDKTFVRKVVKAFSD